MDGQEVPKGGEICLAGVVGSWRGAEKRTLENIEDRSNTVRFGCFHRSLWLLQHEGSWEGGERLCQVGRGLFWWLPPAPPLPYSPGPGALPLPPCRVARGSASGRPRPKKKQGSAKSEVLEYSQAGAGPSGEAGLGPQGWALQAGETSLFPPRCWPLLGGEEPVG